jgi:hypothetical protein
MKIKENKGDSKGYGKEGIFPSTFVTCHGCYGAIMSACAVRR